MLNYVCPVCRSKVSLEVVICQSVDDIQARQLIDYLIKTYQPTLGAATLRYLRLHTPAKQRLSWARVRRILGDLVDAMRSRKIKRSGRDWPVSVDDWQAAFEAVFAAQDKGTLVLPLKSNDYLFAVLVRIVDKSEAIAEAKAEMERRAGPRAAHVSGTATSIGHALDGALQPGAAQGTGNANAARAAAQTQEPVRYTSLAVRRMQEERQRNLARRERLLQRSAGETSAPDPSHTNPGAPADIQQEGS